MKRTKSEALQTRETILKNGLELFMKQGFSATKLEDIAKQSGVTRGAIYWNFKDKLDVLKELVDIEHQKLTALLDKLFNEPTEPINKMKNIIDSIIDHFFNNKTFKDFIELTWFKVEYTQLEALFQTKSETTKYFVNQYRLVVLDAQKTGKIKDTIDAETIAITIGFMIDGMYRSYFLKKRKSTCKQQSIKAFQNYLDLIRTK